MSMDISHYQLPDEVRKRYLDRRSKDIEDCTLKLLSRDWAYFERLGHQLKGNAASYGYRELGHIAFEIESSALNKDLLRLKTCVNAFKSWFQQN